MEVTFYTPLQVLIDTEGLTPGSGLPLLGHHYPLQLLPMPASFSQALCSPCDPSQNQPVILSRPSLP